MNKFSKRYKLNDDFKDYLGDSLETIILTLGNGENIPFEYGETRELIDILNTTDDIKSLKLEKYSIEKILFARNIMSAINLIVSQVPVLSEIINNNSNNISDYLSNIILDIHSRVMRDIQDKNPGVLRVRPVYVKGSNYIPPQYNRVPKILKHVFNALDPKSIESIFLCIIRLMKLQPFLDGNKRTMQLLGSLLMLANGYKPFYTDFKNNIRSIESLINYYEDYNFINYVDNEEKFNKSEIESHELKVANGVFQQWLVRMQNN